MPQQRGDRRLTVRSSASASATLTPIVRTLSPPTKYLLDAPDRHHDLVVGVLERRCRPSAGGSRSTWNGRPPIVIVVPIDVASEPEVVCGRGAEDGDPEAVLDGGVGEERALPDVVGADGRRSRPSCR